MWKKLEQVGSADAVVWSTCVGVNNAETVVQITEVQLQTAKEEPLDAERCLVLETCNEQILFWDGWQEVSLYHIVS